MGLRSCLQALLPYIEPSLLTNGREFEMVDNLDANTRSRVMSAIRSRENKSTELVMVGILRREKLCGWRRHVKVLGTPDFAWPKIKLALFVDGCFWHGCPYCHRPAKSNVVFWRNKLSYNMARDKRVARTLRHMGWSVLRIRECRLQWPSTVQRIVRAYTIRTGCSPRRKIHTSGSRLRCFS